MSEKYCLVYSTCPESGTYAYDISTNLISKKLAACVNIINAVNSIYCWEGSIQNSQEKLLIIKTRPSLFNQVKSEILHIHPYECPEIIMVPIIGGFDKYLSWIDNNL